MKEKLTTSIRHALTAIPALGGYLATKGWLTAGEGAQLDTAQGDFLGVLAAVVAAVVVRLLMLAAAKFVPGLSAILGGDSDRENGKGNSGGMFPALMGMAAAGLLAGFPLSSCSSLSIADDCVLGSYTRDGKTYKAGPCVNADGEVDRVRVLWSNEAGQELRATIYRDDRETVIEYSPDGKQWITWTSDSGVALGPVPPEVEEGTDKAQVRSEK